MAGILDWLAGLGNMLGAATYTRPQDIQAVRGLLPKPVDNALASTFQSPTANDALGVLGGPTLGAIRAFHGSPYDFDKFDLSKIGTGEGAQAYGHGLYFAENPKVAQSYRFAGAGAPVGQGPLAAGLAQDAANAAMNAGLTGQDARTYALNWLHQKATGPAQAASPQHYWDAMNNFDALTGGSGAAGRMYEVNINAEPQQFLDWDKPINQQPQGVKSALENALPSMASDPFLGSSGAKLYGELGRPGFASTPTTTPREASALLHGIGVPGIKYLDQGSRSAGTGTSNYVVFNPGLIDIIRKYGIAAGVSPLAAYAAAQQNQQ